ncbi:flagellin [Rhizobium sp.]|jgi:flagellin|uniref:flagellin N-terminal helical domain-containing protein n=1 Tax=Rhizobium sp. TaxID=391 RepID=UPI000E8EF7B8|nr:flagellar hook associated protein [Rhizobium sp.]
MASVNATSNSALALISGTSKAHESTQTRVATGKKVDNAADNAAYWSIATTMKSDNLSLSSAEDATGLSAAVADTAALGVQQATSLVSDIQSQLIMSKAVGANKDAINTQITQLKQQLSTVADSSSFNGQNWLKLGASESPSVKQMVSSVGSDSNGNLAVNVVNFDTAKSALVSQNNANDGILTRAYTAISIDGTANDYYLLDAKSQTPASSTAKEIAVSNNTSNSDIDGMISATKIMIYGLTNAGSAIGATQSRISASTDFIKDLQDVNTISTGRLTDANMEEEATKLSSQKAQAQLQTIGLNIANTQQRSITQLFL